VDRSMVSPNRGRRQSRYGTVAVVVGSLPVRRRFVMLRGSFLRPDRLLQQLGRTDPGERAELRGGP
jgi:hypothetical protein